MEQRLHNAAMKGDVEALYSILAEDPYLLERIDDIPFVDTPLHIAASLGKIHFSKEILSLKPSFAWKRNHLGRSPIHLALENGHRELVRWLLTISSELVRVKAKGMVTPLHYAAEIDDEFSLADFLYVCPSSIHDLTVKCESAVHVALQKRCFRAFKVLLGWLRHFDKENILEWEDENGDTALHIATLTNQPEAVKLLIRSIEVNIKNRDGLTALDIFNQHKASLNPEVGKILLRAKAKQASELDKITSKVHVRLKTKFCSLFVYNPVTDLVNYLTGDLSWRENVLKWLTIGGQCINKLPFEVRNVILVVASLIATATYQAALSPPGGYWQDDCNNPSANTTTVKEKGQAQHTAGKRILGTSSLYFFGLNSVAFYTSACTILIVIVGLRFSRLIAATTCLLIMSYTSAVIETSSLRSGVVWACSSILMLASASAAFLIPSFLLTKEKVLEFYGRGKLRLGALEHPKM